MKKMAIISLIITSVIIIQSCSNTPEQTAVNQTSDYDKHLSVYERSMKLKDYYTAIVALNYMREADSSYSRYTDSLIKLYASARLFNSVIVLGDEILEQYPEKDTIRELVAISNNSLGNYNKAYSDFDMLYKKNPNPATLYNMAKIKYLLEKPQEAAKLYTQIINDTSSFNEMAEFPSRDGSLQSVSLVAGCYMQLAQIDAQAQKLQSAMSNLQKALKISPGFEEAQYSLQQLLQYQESMKYQRQMQQGGAGAPGYR